MVVITAKFSPSANLRKAKVTKICTKFHLQRFLCLTTFSGYSCMDIADKAYVRDESTYNYIAHEHVRACDMDSLHITYSY